MTEQATIPAVHPETVRARIVLNPRAGNAEDIGRISAALKVWRARGWQVDVTPTTYAGHAIELAREAAAQGYDVVVAAGGDGTVNEVVNGIARTNAALAVLPVGTGNVWVRELKLPLRPDAAAASIDMRNIIELDLGLAGDRYFLLMAGVGFDAAVTRAVDPAAKRKLGLLAYIVQAVLTARDIRGKRVRIMIDGRQVRGRVLMVVISNSRLYGGFLQITHHASLTDGLLDVAVIKGQDVRSAPLHILSILLRRYNLNPDMDYYRAREVHISGVDPLEVQVDGDAIGMTPMTFQVAPAALRALVPTWSTSDLQGLPAGLRLPMLDRIRRILIDGPQHRT
ncbi:MAG: diacylglycerol kinase family lipid kinase [Chloroflexota bacterium]|nr:diacylglycerol kinase family lipid kinase [Chloroflexota bacterium]